MLSNAITISNGKGGVGKTSIAANLAGVLAANGWTVLAIDLDRQGHLSGDLGAAVDRRQGGRELFEALCHDGVLEPTVRDVRPGLDLICGGAYVESAEGTLSQRPLPPALLGERLRPIASGYDAVVIDTPPAGGAMSALALGASRGVVAPVRADRGSAEGVGVLWRQLQEVKVGSGQPLDLLGVVVFGVETTARAIRAEITDMLTDALGEAAPVFSTVVRHSSRTAFDTRATGRLASEYEATAESVHAQRLDALRSGTALPTGTYVSSAAAGIAGDYQNLAAEVFTRLKELEHV